jgi:hypothetical protein
MQIIINNPEAFVTYKRTTGIVLHTPENHQVVNFFSHLGHRKVNRNDLGSPSMSKLEEELLTNEHLRAIAYEHNFIEVHDQEVVDFLKYANSYN